MPRTASSASPPVSSASGLSAPSRRKRSSPTNTLHSTSSNSALVYPVPESIAWLEQLTLSVVPVPGPKHKTKDAKYVLAVHHTKSGTTWSHARTFDDYRVFQLRLQKALRHGHFCHAECPWLFTFVKSYFPKTYVFGSLLAPRHVIDTRREMLQRCFHTLQTFLVNRNNHCCSVLTTAVADEVVAFVNGDEGKAHQCSLAPAQSSECAALAALTHGGLSSNAPRKSWDSIANSDVSEMSHAILEDLELSERISSSEDEDMCPLCKVHLAEEANIPTSSDVTPSSTPSTTETSPVSPVHEQYSPVPTLRPPPRPLKSKRPGQRRRVGAPHFYTTRLACGHRFHDECIVPRLNESMTCPVCGLEEKKR